MVDIFIPPVGCAMFGALSIKLLELTELYKLSKLQRPDFKDILYWVPFIVLPIVGGGAAYLYVASDIVLTPILAANIGVSAPLFFRAMAQLNPFQPKTIETEPDA